MSPLTISSLTRRFEWWTWACILLAVVSIPPVSYFAYQDLLAANRTLRVQLIEHYRLWETESNYRGTPQSWTRFAVMLLDTDQLMDRVRVAQGALAREIEEDFYRDATFAYGRVFAGYAVGWITPLALLYAAGWLGNRRKAK